MHPELAQSLDDDGSHVSSAPRRSGQRRDSTIPSSTVTATISRALRTELAAGDLLDHHDRVRTLGDQAGVEQVTGEHAEQPVAELLVVDQHPFLRASASHPESVA